MNKFSLYCSLVCFSLAMTVSGQDTGPFSGLSEDQIFMKARNLAHAGEPGAARDAALYLFALNPSNFDAALLIARVYAWEGNYDSAQEYIRPVIVNDSCHYEALSVMLDMGLWQGDHEMSNRMAETALRCHPDDEDFLYRKSRALLMAGDIAGALGTIDHLLDLNPEHKEAAGLKKKLTAPGFYYFRENNYILAGYYGELYNEPYSRHMYIATAGYSHFTGIGPLTAKLNFSNTYIEGSGQVRNPEVQYEIESYPKYSSQGYLFLNYAWSAGTMFPRHRSAAEIYRKLPFGFEASAGLRYLYWDRSWFFYTGSIAKYYSDYWFSLRPYVFPGDDGVSSSWFFNARKYFSTADDFAGLIMGYGFSPDETLSELTGRLYLNTTTLGAEFSRGFGAGYLVRGSLRYENEEYTVNTYRGRWIFSLGLRYYL
jgi:YaiO family outer membrane protein